MSRFFFFFGPTYTQKCLVFRCMQRLDNSLTVKSEACSRNRLANPSVGGGISRNTGGEEITCAALGKSTKVSLSI